MDNQIMRRLALFVVLAIGVITGTPSSAQNANDLIRFAADSIANRDFSVFDEASRAYLRGDGQPQVLRLRQLGTIKRIIGGGDDVSAEAWTATGRAIHENGASDWRLRYHSESRKIEVIELTATLIGENLTPLAHSTVYRDYAPGGADPKSLAPCSTFPALCSDAQQSTHTVEFLFATTRQKTSASGRVSFSGERADEMSFGAARVQIPKEHHIGKIELATANWWNFVYEVKTDPDKHFVIQNVTPMSRDEWTRIIDAKKSDEALVFVHGFRTSFDDSLYRMGQIIYDLKYQAGIPVLFTWASRGNSIFDYAYDQVSAQLARSNFLNLLRILEVEHGIKRIHILAHSMGNLLVLEALKDQANTPNPLTIGEYMMAAPDVDRDMYRIDAPQVRKITSGMTLYASSTDKALMVSREVFGDVPRAGGVTTGGPIVLPQIDSIDVTEVGNDILGLDHDVFAGTRAVMDDISVLLTTKPRRPPDQRLAEIRGMPEGAVPPAYWRYVP